MLVFVIVLFIWGCDDDVLMVLGLGFFFEVCEDDDGCDWFWKDCFWGVKLLRKVWLSVAVIFFILMFVLKVLGWFKFVCLLLMIGLVDEEVLMERWGLGGVFGRLVDLFWLLLWSL